jgi:formamidopyrimidine-DNA glycosylase
MPELPDITVYLNALRERIDGKRIERLSILRPFLLRTVEPPPAALAGRRVTILRRIGKRIAIGVEDDLWIVIHLMIAGRLHWQTKPPKRWSAATAAVVELENGFLSLTEAGTKKRASLAIVRGEEALAAHDPGGLEVMSATLSEFAAAIRRENHTLKRALTDPTILSGIGNAYSDELLHRARLSPMQLTSSLDDEQMRRLYEAVQTTLAGWTDRLDAERAGEFPGKVTAFRPQMAVHGRFGQPCPDCGTAVQRIRYANNETNYCPRCQTGGKILADRALSRLLKKDFPRSIEELEARKAARIRER